MEVRNIVIEQRGMQIEKRVKGTVADVYRKFKDKGTVSVIAYAGDVKLICEVYAVKKTDIAIMDTALEEAVSTIPNQRIHWDNIDCYHWIFDYKLPCGIYCENILVDNDLKTVHCTIISNKFAYLCDRHAECGDECGSITGYKCAHTLNADHAVHKAVINSVNAANYSDFDQISRGVYFERRLDI